LASGYIYIQHLATRGVPDYDGKLVLKGLSNEVTVYREGHAVPHIYAKNERDLYMAIGYCMAQDRLFQMDLIHRATMGRLSGIFCFERLEAAIQNSTDLTAQELLDKILDQVNTFAA